MYEQFVGLSLEKFDGFVDIIVQTYPTGLTTQTSIYLKKTIHLKFDKLLTNNCFKTVLSTSITSSTFALFCVILS